VIDVELVRTIQEVRQAVRSARQAGKTIGFMPTLGYMHEGHLSLIRAAREECDFVVVSIFVNPTQFGPNEDFDRYPRDLERDLSLCRSAGVDLVFHPSVQEMYPQPFLTQVRVGKITERLCGASRPGHFEGVATVVAKLLNIVRPDRAYFGQKDAQQVAVIKRMVADLNMDEIEIRAMPTVREPDGLAMSSRNVYLSPEERKAATVLYRSLKMAQERVAAGERDLAALREAMRAMIAAEPLASIDYVEIVDVTTLEPIDRLEKQALAALAVRFGKTRLIDNVVLEAPSGT
jgi:pantoate--beta-alanine ligase